jgi:hypothetical protein
MDQEIPTIIEKSSNLLYRPIPPFACNGDSG